MRKAQCLVGVERGTENQPGAALRLVPMDAFRAWMFGTAQVGMVMETFGSHVPLSFAEHKLLHNHIYSRA
jgi:hypothetical protein